MIHTVKGFGIVNKTEIGAGQERGSRERVWGGMNMAAPRGQGSPVVLSGLAIAAGNARFVGSWVPVDWHPASRAQGCGPQNLGSGACKLQELFKGFIAPGCVESSTQELNPCSLHRHSELGSFLGAHASLSRDGFQ